MLQEGWLYRERLARTTRANEICALVKGFREKRPNLRRIQRDLVGKVFEEPRQITDTQRQILDESHRRVRGGLNGNGDAR